LILAGRNLEVAYARAAGRGRSSEADVTWEKALAGEVLARNQTIERVPDAEPSTDRLKRAYVMVCPSLWRADGRGPWCCPLRRPEYSELHRALADWFADTAIAA